MSIEIYFTEPEEKERSRDPLGFLSLVMKKREESLPGITSNTSRAGYYILMATYNKLKDGNIGCKFSNTKLVNYLDILFLKSNLELKDAKYILGKSKIKSFKKNKKLSKIIRDWIKTKSTDYYWASFKEIFKNGSCPLSERNFNEFKKCISKDKVKSFHFLIIKKANNGIKKWLKENIITGKREDFFKVLKKDIKKIKKDKDPEKFIRNLFINNPNKYKSILNDVPIIERFLWAYETIFLLSLNLLKFKDELPDDIQPIDCNDDKIFLNEWNKWLEKDTKSKEDPEAGKDTDDREGIELDGEKTKERLCKIIGYYKHIMARYKNIYSKYSPYLPQIKFPDNAKEVCYTLLKTHYECRQSAAFVKKEKNKFVLKKQFKNYDFTPPLFPKRYYGIYNFISILKDLGEI